jgi:beta-glucosidase
VENLSRQDRFTKAINAGVVQIGDSEQPEFIISAVHEGKISEACARDAAYRILVQRFAVGLLRILILIRIVPMQPLAKSI